jgi:hypothetical protein
LIARVKACSLSGAYRRLPGASSISFEQGGAARNIVDQFHYLPGVHTRPGYRRHTPVMRGNR